jgi:hypothetical protein
MLIHLAGQTDFRSYTPAATRTTAPNVTRQFDPLTKLQGFSGSFGATYNVSDAFLIKGNIRVVSGRQVLQKYRPMARSRLADLSHRR